MLPRRDVDLHRLAAPRRSSITTGSPGRSCRHERRHVARSSRPRGRRSRPTTSPARCRRARPGRRGRSRVTVGPAGVSVPSMPSAPCATKPCSRSSFGDRDARCRSARRRSLRVAADRREHDAGDVAGPVDERAARRRQRCRARRSRAARSSSGRVSTATTASVDATMPLLIHGLRARPAARRADDPDAVARRARDRARTTGTARIGSLRRSEQHEVGRVVAPDDAASTCTSPSVVVTLDVVGVADRAASLVRISPLCRTQTPDRLARAVARR